MSLPTNLGWWTGSFPYHRHANRTNSTLGKDTANPVANHHLRQFRYKLRSQISSSHFCYLTFSVFLPTPHFPCLLPPTQPHAPSSLFVISALRSLSGSKHFRRLPDVLRDGNLCSVGLCFLQPEADPGESSSWMLPGNLGSVLFGSVFTSLFL